MKKKQKMESINSKKFKKLASEKIEALADVFGGVPTYHYHDTHNWAETGYFLWSDDHMEILSDRDVDSSFK